MVERIQAEMATSIAIDTIKATNSLRGLTSAVTAVKNAWKSEEIAAKSTGNYLKAAQERYNGLGREMDAQKNKINELKQRQTELDVTTQKGAENYLKYEKDIQRATAQMESLTAQQKRAKSSMEYQSSGLADLQRDYKQLNSVSHSYVERLKAEGNERQANIAKANSLRDALSNLTQQYDRQQNELKRVQSESGGASEAYRKQGVRVNETATNIAKMKTELKETQREVNRANPYGLGKYSSGANAAYRASVKMGNGFETASHKIIDGAKRASLALLGIGAGSIKGAKMASDLQESYVKTTNLAVTGGEKAAEAQKNVNQMQKDGQKYSVEYGKSQKDIADGYQELIKRGYTSAEALGAMKSELQASVASGDDFNNVLTVTSQVVDAYGMRTDNAAKMTKNTKEVVNQLAYAADMTATDFQSLGKGMEYVGDSAHSAGYALSETSSAMGILSNHGLEADKAGTGLRKVVNSLTSAIKDQDNAQIDQTASVANYNGKIAEHQKKIEEIEAAEKAGTKTKKSATSAIKTQKDAIEKLESKIQSVKAGGTNDMLSKLGISKSQLVDSNGNLVSLTKQMEVINEATKHMGTAEKNSVFNSLFGTTGQQAGIILAQNNQELDELNKKVKKSADGQGYVADLAKRNMGTVKAEMSQFKEAGNAALIMMGKEMLPTLSEMAVAMTKAFDSKKGQDGLKLIAKGIGAAFKLLGDVVVFIGSHQKTVEAFAVAFGSIWALNKISNTISMLKNLNETLKITKALSAFSIGGSVNIGKPVGAKAVAAGGEAAIGEAGLGKLAIGGMGSKAASFGSSLLPILTKAIPWIAAGSTLVEFADGISRASKTKDQGKNRSELGGAFGSLGGTGLGAAIGTAVAPGIGTAIGAVLGGAGGKLIGKKFGKAYQDGFKESHPKSISAWLGKDWDSAYKNSVSKNMKSFSKAYNDQISKLNGTIGIKMSVDTKDVKKNKQQVEGIYRDLQKTIDNFYAQQAKDSKKDLDILVKNGVITQKQEDNILKTSQKKNNDQKKDKEKLANDMKKTSEKYYSDVKKIQNGGTKELQKIAQKYGKNSKQYKKEQNKELTRIGRSYSKDMVGIEVKLNTQVSKATSTAAVKQKDILNDLSKSKNKIGLKQIAEDERQAKKNHNTIVNEAWKTRNDTVKAANSKYKGTVAAADKEYYQNHTISKKQYDKIVGKARDQRDDTIDAAETQRKKTTKKADEQYGEILDKAEKQRYNVTHKSKLQKDGVTGHLREQKDKTTRLGREQSSTLSDWAEKQKHNTTKSADQQNKGISGGFQTFWNVMKGIASTGLGILFSPINVGINAINGLIGAFGGSKHAVPKIPTKFATGTGLFSNLRRPILTPTLAMLNDGHDSPETGNKEMLIHPDGRPEVIQGANVIRKLEPGSEVLNASETRMFHNMHGISHFAEGTGFWSNIWGGIKSTGSSVGSFFSDSWDMIKDSTKKFTEMFKFITGAVSHPIKTLEKKFNPKRDKNMGSVFNGLGDDVFYKQTKKQAGKWWKELWSMAKDAGEGGSGSSSELLNKAIKYGTGKPYVWGATGPDSFDCSGLVQYTLKQMGKSFPHYSGSQYNSSTAVSKPSVGDLVFFGNGGSEHVGIYSGGGKMFSAQSPDSHPNIGYAKISNWNHGLASSPYRRVPGLSNNDDSKKEDKGGSSLQKLIKSQVGGMFKWIGKNIAPLNDDEGDSGSSPMPNGSHENWLKQAGINGNFSKWNYIINHESGWNPKAKNPSSDAYGIGQALPPSKMASFGSDYMTNAVTQLKWMKSYVNDRYGGIDGAYDWWKSHHWYANGTITNTPHVAHIAEGGMTEAVIPWDLSKKSRSMELLGETVTHFAKNSTDGSGNVQTSNNSDASVLSELKNQFNEVIQLIGQLVQGQANPTPAYVIANQASQEINKVNNNGSRLTRNAMG